MENRVAPPDYFVSPVPSLWGIHETGEAIEWRDEPSTAILLPHLRILCESLTSQLRGLPPLSAVLFIVDALSKDWSESLSNLRTQQLIRASGVIHDFALVNSIAQWLSSLKVLDPEFRRGARAHQAFLCELFEQLPRNWLTGPKETAKTMTWLENIVGDRSVLLNTRLKSESTAAERSLLALEFASAQSIDSESLRLRMRTGLDKVPDGESLEVVEQYPLAALVKQISSENDDLGGMARLAQSISATLTLPRLPSDPDVLPIGGVSDVTNRGAPDRLLMSELALDSDLLIARIANGQALYLRREQPPQPEPKHRCLIVESGVRLWGTMRLYSVAFAIGMCIAQERRGGETMDVVTVSGDQAWQEDLSTRAGIERFFERLSVDIHPGGAVMNLWERQLFNLDLDTQPILLLSQATERDAEFHQHIRDFPRPHLVARIEQAGWVELLNRSSVGDTPLQRMQLKETEAAAPKSKTAASNDLPLFLQQSPTPLRFSVHVQGDCVQTYCDGVHEVCWVLTSDRRAMMRDEETLGAIEVGSVPNGRILACYTPNRTTWLLVIESRPYKSTAIEHLLVVVQVRRGVSVHKIKLGDHKPTEQSYCFDQEQLIRVGSEVAFLDSRTGAVLASAPCSHPHLGGRFFGGNEVYVISRNDNQVKWQQLAKVPTPAGFAARREHGMPVVYAHDLSWMMLLDGHNVLNPLPSRAHTTSRHEIVRINATGTEMLVAIKGVSWANDSRIVCKANEEKLLNVSLKEAHITSLGERQPEHIHAFETRSHKYNYSVVNVRTHISGMSFDGDSIILVSRGTRLTIELDKVEQYYLSLVPQKTSIKTQYYSFGKSGRQSDDLHARWRLRYIKLPKGDAWLDSRGLLHLRAADGSEVTLVLNDHRVSGWQSNGQLFGSNYFTGGSTTGDCRSVHQWLVRFAREQQ